MKEKRIQIIILSLLLSAFILNCEAKPEKDFYGISEEETNLLVAGFLANQSLTDTRTGTIRDPAAGLEWQKCSVGQVYRQAQNDCQGAAAGTVLNPQDPYRYGARQLAYCDSKTHACNRVTVPQVLLAVSEIAISGSSEAYLACSALGTSWRVPTPIELKRLTETGRISVLNYFPQTQEAEYWSSWSNEQDIPGETAISISFDRQSFGQQKNTVKTDRNYVRCVKNL
ncbi:surface adhesin Lsa25 [Leptospira sp. 'Mane']|uniref:surface adhesin Lsa25 n=1 Tax=Leptospira sp. 'Mane' TaxID=3387407 RepID=UPI00398AABC2